MYTVVTFFDGQGSNLLGHTVALVLLNNSPLNSRPSAVEISIINSDHVKGRYHVFFLHLKLQWLKTKEAILF